MPLITNKLQLNYPLTYDMHEMANGIAVEYTILFDNFASKYAVHISQYEANRTKDKNKKKNENKK